MPAMVVSNLGYDQWSRSTYPSAIWRLTIILIIMPHFMEIVFVQLSNETREVAVLEVFGQNVLCEFLVLSRTVSSSRRRAHMTFTHL
jgi:hypothetical protein